MNYQHKTNKTIVSYYGLKTVYPDSVLAKDGTVEIIDYHVIATTPKPVYDATTEVCEAGEPVNYTQVWNVRPMTTSELAEVAEREQRALEAEAKKGLTDTAVLVPTDVNDTLDAETQQHLVDYRASCINVLDAAHTTKPDAHHKVKTAVKKYK